MHWLHRWVFETMLTYAGRCFAFGWSSQRKTLQHGSAFFFCFEGCPATYGSIATAYDYYRFYPPMVFLEAQCSKNRWNWLIIKGYMLPDFMEFPWGLCLCNVYFLESIDCLFMSYLYSLKRISLNFLWFYAFRQMISHPKQPAGWVFESWHSSDSELFSRCLNHSQPRHGQPLSFSPMACSCEMMAKNSHVQLLLIHLTKNWYLLSTHSVIVTAIND